MPSLTGHSGLSDAQTLRETTADNESMFRIGVVAALVSALLFVATAWALYTLLTHRRPPRQRPTHHVARIAAVAR